MISDELLAAAAGEISAAMGDCAPATEHAFSPAFEKRMAVLLRRGTHPVRRQVLRYVAAALIAAVTVFAGAYLLSPTVQATVNGWVGNWIRSTFGGYIQYQSADDTQPDAEYDYFLPEEFDGYTLIEVMALENSKVFTYAHPDGRVLQFIYVYGTQSNSIFLDVENSTHSTIRIGSNTADLYLSKDPEQTSILVWEDEETGALLTISAVENKKNLLAIANKIEKTEKISN